MLVLALALLGLPAAPEVTVDVPVAPADGVDLDVTGRLGDTIDDTLPDLDAAAPDERGDEPAAPQQRRVGQSAATAGASAGAAGLLGLLARALAAMPLAHLFSRIDNGRVLEHPARASIHTLLESEPGLPMRAVQERLGIAWGTVVHHLRRLQNAGLVVAARHGQHRRWYVANTPEARARTIPVLGATAHRIALLVHRRPGIDQSTVCDELGLLRPAASKHLNRFRDAGLVAAERDGRRVVYAPTSMMSAALARAHHL